MKTALGFVFFLITLYPVFSHAAQGSASECVSTREPETPQYQVGRTLRTTTKTPQLILYVALDPAALKPGPMRALGRALNRQFCKDATIEATIVDDVRAASKWDPFHVPELYGSAIRGSYYLDRAKGKEYIAFSNARGRGFDEFINLQSADAQPAPRSYRDVYKNAQYGYSVAIPASLMGTAAVPKEREGGINISLSTKNDHYIWVGATENIFRFSSLQWAIDFQRAWIEADGSQVLSFTEDTTYRLGKLKGTRLTVRYKPSKSEQIMVKDFVLALTCERNAVGTLYRIEMTTSQDQYVQDRKLFESVVRSWRI